ncbi:MAG: DM13 domain-containing protein [Halioglobus sp.]|nr:DM13 domain-containing protein [Halioglobus sp.]
MAKPLLLVCSHVAVAGLGFFAGIYTLPILMAPPAPEVRDVASLQQRATYSGEFRRDLADSDFLHWGEGTVYLEPGTITFKGKLAPGPDYRLYLSPQFVETESDFEALKSQMVEIGPVQTFDNFVVPVPAAVDLASYDTAIVWCESFGEFITSARYR